MEDIVQIKITLQDTKPVIWRRIQVKKNITFFELHNTIQIAMGWKNSHMFEFRGNGYSICLPDEMYSEMSMGEEIHDVIETKLSSILKEVNQTLEYEYDFGDGWEHEILVEKFLPIDTSVRYPNCIDGGMNCPPEDCGGTHGFYYLMSVIKDKKHPEHNETIEWLDGGYNPNEFDLEETNKRLLFLLKTYMDMWNDNDL